MSNKVKIIGIVLVVASLAAVFLRDRLGHVFQASTCDEKRTELVANEQIKSGRHDVRAINDSMLGRIAATVREEFIRLQSQGLPGALVAISAPGNDDLILELGQSDIVTRSPMTRDHSVRIGSISKIFVGTVFLQLVEERGIDLDTPVSHYLAGIPRAEDITLRMLGNHTSGLFDSISDKAFRARINADPARLWERDEILRVAFAHEPRCRPGETFSYANTNTILLAEIAERISGQSSQDLIDQRILKPLGMAHTGVPARDPESQTTARGYRHGYNRDRVEYGEVFFDATRFSASWSDAAGNMNSTLDDLLKAVKPLVTGELLSETGRAELGRFIVASDDFSYSFTLMDYSGLIGHAGDMPGFSSFMAWLPEFDAGIVVLTNLSNLKDGSSPAIHLATAIHRGFYGDISGGDKP